MTDNRASASDRAYFERIARANLAPAERPPNSFAEMLERLDSIKQRLGDLAVPGIAQEDPDGDWDSHRAYVAHIRAVVNRRRDAGTR